MHDQIRTRLQALGAAVAILLATAALGCGAPTGPGPVALLIGDSTSSFESFSPACVPDFVTVAKAVAVRRGDLYAGALLSGDPYGGTYGVEAHFDEPPPPAIEGNDRLEQSHRVRKAEALADDFEDLSRVRAERDGSPVMTTLERAARFNAQRTPSKAKFWLVLCADLAAVEPGLDTRYPIDDADVVAAVSRWAPRLAELRGADIYVIGAGRLRPGSKARPDSIRQVERVITEIAKRIGARVRLIDTELGGEFPVGAERP